MKASHRSMVLMSIYTYIHIYIYTYIYRKLQVFNFQHSFVFGYLIFSSNPSPVVRSIINLGSRGRLDGLAVSMHEAFFFGTENLGRSLSWKTIGKLSQLVHSWKMSGYFGDVGAEAACHWNTWSSMFGSRICGWGVPDHTACLRHETRLCNNSL